MPHTTTTVSVNFNRGARDARARTGDDWSPEARAAALAARKAHAKSGAGVAETREAVNTSKARAGHEQATDLHKVAASAHREAAADPGNKVKAEHAENATKAAFKHGTKVAINKEHVKYTAKLVEAQARLAKTHKPDIAASTHKSAAGTHEIMAERHAKVAKSHQPMYTNVE